MGSSNHGRILISGATGLIGSAITRQLRAQGTEVVALTRDPKKYDGESIAWNPTTGQLESHALENFDAMIHLTGENIAGRWTAEKRARIRDSRVLSTQLLADRIQRLSRPPRVFLCASAMGVYGDRGDEILDENSQAGSGFMAEVCGQWEAACEPIRARETRVVNMRFTVVLSAGGGALKMMLTPFRLGIGGRLGHGRQWMSWINIDDATAAMLHVLSNDRMSGPINFSSPNPLRNSEFTAILAHVVKRPAIFTVPKTALRLLLGTLAEEAFLSSCRVLPKKLEDSDFQFRFPTLEMALHHELNKDQEKRPVL